MSEGVGEVVGRDAASRRSRRPSRPGARRPRPARAQVTARVDRRLTELPDPIDARARLVVVFEELLPLDDEGVDLLVVHHAFGSMAFTDSTLAASPFSATEDLHTDLVAALRSLGTPTGNADRDAAALIAMVTGLGVGIAFGQYGPELARTVLHHHLDVVLPAGA